MTSKPLNRSVIAFYEDEVLDMTILEILNDITTKRNRSNKIKDILIEYFNEKYPEEFNEVKNRLSENMEQKTTPKKVSINKNNQSSKEDDALINLVENNKDKWGSL
ncbi:precorrin-4 C11-methyltransferase [Clostridium botulinum]|uniref:precorrin-4 C11-methyltransferase n=1 Tax=Clostridium botulinum TaxID=1491 RepID=UPI0013C8574F|nr:precorrin-4 C11-methyltransferase [Clostridium botulinum]MBD5575843.1 precorrin-4 C11-methyltransferase [Clostridium botulinum]MBD5592950.1 precorrin-4 C11-methyltransferase [Clostridium botulinum]MBD5625433.1 precorrin-4 C11-methyltransferase [Clostridium botulinum]MBD5631341.1 precorrin-4 C11-methyltransferase [Clostridium botulinum]MBD5645762.1 precorrin-4 C11-methyltransferase [Clostridium botulinum]